MAREVELKDLDGAGMTVLEYDGLLLPKRWTDPPSKLNEIKNFTYKEGDIFLCSYPKTGSHWLYALVSLVINDNVDVKNTPIAVLPLIDMFDTNMIGSRPVPRATSSHLWYDRLPREHLQNKGKIILIVRNPKDVAVSRYHFLQKEPAIMYNGSWNYFLGLFLDGKVPYGSYFEFLNTWCNAIHRNPGHEILVIYFEELKENCLNQLVKISKYLGKEVDEVRLQEIIERCSLDNLREEVERKTFTFLDKDGKSVVYRKGKVGDWKNHFTVTESETFDIVMEQKLKNCSFKFRFS